jgi:hypothetical protein
VPRCFFLKGTIGEVGEKEPVKPINT